MIFYELWNVFKNIILKNICDRLLLTRLYFWTFNRLVISNVVHGPAGDKRNINIFRMAFFRTAQGWRGGGGDRPTPPKNLSYIFYSDVLGIPYLKNIQNIWRVTHPLISADISNFSPEISKFCYIKEYEYRMHFDLLLFLSL